MDDDWKPHDPGHHEPDFWDGPDTGDYSSGILSFLDDDDKVPGRPLL
jgi:hypothetical protein